MGSVNDESSPSEGRQFECTYDATTPPSMAVVEAIATIENAHATSPSGFGFTLYNHVDPDALDALVGDGSRSGTLEIEFTAGAYRVRVDGFGRVLVSKRE